MRIPRNYMNSHLASNNTSSNSLLQRALSRSSKNKRTSRTSLLMNAADNRKNLLTSNTASAAQSQKLYYNMKYHAEQVKNYAEKLTDAGSKSLFAAAKESGDVSEAVSAVKGFVSQYNSMLDNLKESGTRADTLYRTQLNSYSNIYASEMAKCGVKRNADGTLSVDEKALAATDADTLEKVWSGSNGFVSRAASWADSVAAGAERNMEAQASNAYSSLFDNYGNSGKYFNFFR